jgi:cytochrome b561
MTATANPRPRPLRYSASAKLMHWVIAVVVILMIPEGMTMKRLIAEGPTRDYLYTLHEAIGALVLIVMIARLARRLIFGVPAPERTLPPGERDASLAAQYALYLLLLIVPVLGWLGTNAYGDPVSVFGLFNFPALLGKDVPLSDRIFVWHLAGGLLIAAIVAAHAAAALYHHFVKRDAVLARMLPGD